jgi:hypothetical protein
VRTGRKRCFYRGGERSRERVAILLAVLGRVELPEGDVEPVV